MNDIIKKINTLPSDIQDILLSDRGRQLELEIFEKHSLPKFLSLIGDIVTALYVKDISFDILISEIKETFELSDDEAAKKIAIDIVGKRALIVDEYFAGEASKYIESQGGSVDDYSECIADTKEAVRKQMSGEDEIEENDLSDVEIEEEEKAPPKYVYSEEQEIADSVDVFGSSLVLLLQSKDNPHIADFNASLINLLTNSEGFQERLKEALLTNEEKITSAEFVLGGKRKPATIGNWIADFTKQKGADLFDLMVLLSYLTNSENGQKLTEEEKKLVGRLLKLYRNVKFFPEVLENIPIEKWEIIPVYENESLDKIGKYDGVLEKKLRAEESPKASNINVNTSTSSDEIKKDNSVNIKDDASIYTPQIQTQSHFQVQPQAQKLTGSLSSEEIRNNEALSTALIGKNKIKTDSGEVEQNIKNWLADYDKFIGQSEKSLSSRLTYLSNSSSARNLSMADKEVLGLILKSLDDDIDLEFDIKSDRTLDVTLPKRKISIDDLSAVDTYSLKKKVIPENKMIEEKKIAGQVNFSHDNRDVKTPKPNIVENTKVNNSDIDNKVEKIISTLGKSFENDTLSDRFKKAVLTRVKGIRSKVQMQEIFGKAVESGGLGMSSDEAESIADNIENTINGKHEKYIQKSNKIKSPTVETKEAPKVMTAPESTSAQVIEKTELKPTAKEESHEDLQGIENLLNKGASKPKSDTDSKQAEAPIMPTVSEKAKPKDEVMMEVIAPTANFAQMGELEKPKNFKQPKVAESEEFEKTAELSKLQKSVKITDVVSKPKPQGPIQELSALNIESFNRLGNTTAEKISKIINRIAVLENESLIKKAEGIKAWKQSVVYKLYQQMGQESLISGDKISEVIAKRHKSGKPCFKQDEFDAISDLNKTLRF